MADTLTACTYVEKGGVGKTTCAAHLAIAAAQHHELDVVLLDLAGTQNDLATQFGLESDIADNNRPVSAVFGDNWSMITDAVPNIVEEMTFDTGEGPDLIPSSEGLDGVESNLTNVPREDRFNILDKFIRDQLADRYDLILVDLPGKEDNIALNGLRACEHVIAPVVPGAFEQSQLTRLNRDLDELLSEYGADPRLSLVIPNRVQRGQRLDQKTVEQLKEKYTDRVSPVVRKSQDVSNLQAEGKTLFAVSEDELLSTAIEARDAFAAATDQLLTTLTND